MTANQRGIVAIFGCMASYTVNDVLVKQILRDYPVGEVIFVRGLISTLLIGGFVLALGHVRQLRAAMGRLMAARSVCDGLSTACFIAALAHMQLANVAAVLAIGPLLITALSVLFHSEAVGWRRWTAVAVGFFGALLIIKPVPWAFDVWAVVAAGSALFAALRELYNRKIDHSVPTVVIEPGDLARLFVASVFVGIAIYLMALGFRNVDLSVVAPFRYSYLITSALGGYLVFSELPDGWSLAGAALIVGSGLYALHREVARKRALTAEASTAL
jgi:drug/metabolite transporter (DMT)-like permease